MTIAITGANGFIGTELLEFLSHKKGIEIIALTRGSELTEASSTCIHKSTDYSVKNLTAALQGVEIVIHLAGVRGTSSNPEDYSANIDIMRNLLQAISEVGAKRIVFASSISVYDDVESIPWKEDDLLKGRTAYGDSKITCEQLIAQGATQSGYTYAIARIAQVIGEGETRRGMMNVFIDSARKKEVLNVIGKSIAVRQYIYVKDLVNILTILAIGNERYEPNNDIIINAGMREAYTNLEIAKIVNRVFGNTNPIAYDDSRMETIKSSYMDTSRMNKELGYVTRNMEEAISEFL